MENSTIHLGHTAAHDYRGSLGQAQLARPTTRPFASRCNWAPLVQAQRRAAWRGHGQHAHYGKLTTG
jgi:hypothetical protein